MQWNLKTIFSRIFLHCKRHRRGNDEIAPSWLSKKMFHKFLIFFTVQRARGLLTKGKNGTNNCFTTIALGKEKYQTSLKENSPSNLEWHEECEL